MPDPVADLLADLDPAQREAALATSGPVCILAGAGTGKTRAISHRVALCRRDRDGGAPARARRHVHRQGRRRDAGAAGGARPTRDRGLDVPCRGAAPAPALLAPGHRHRPPGGPRDQGPDARRPGPRAARRLPLRRRARPRRRDRVGEGSPGVAGRLRGGRPGRRPRRSAPGAPLRAALPALRGGQGAGRPDRLRGHARDDRPAPRGRAGDRRRGPGPLSLVQRRRVPGHERPPAGAPRRLARRSATTSRSSATRTRRSTRSPGPRRSG